MTLTPADRPATDSHDELAPAVPDTVFHAHASVWHQSELGSAFEIGALSVIGELDPTGERGVLKEVLWMFRESLDPFLALLERHRAHGSSSGIKFEAHKLSSAAAQVGALRLAAACRGITAHFDSGEFHAAPERLDGLVDDLVTETVRVQRQLRQLLGEAPAGGAAPADGPSLDWR